MAYNEKYDWGIFNGVKVNYDYKDKQTNVMNQVSYMIDRSLLMFKYTGLPETIPAKELERLLQTAGFAGIAKAKGELYAFTGGLGGEPDEYYQPTKLVVANPALKYNASLTLDEDVVVIRNDTARMGLVPIYSKYSKLMIENEITMALSNVNKRVSNLISVSDDNTAESARLYLKKLEEGDLGFIMENKLYDSLKTSAMNNSGTTMTELIEYQQYLKATMYNEIGINANGNMKRERLITDEIEVNNEALYPLIDNMLDCRLEGLAKINEMFGTNITVELNSSWDNYRQDGDTDLNERVATESELDEDMYADFELGEYEEEQPEPSPTHLEDAEQALEVAEGKHIEEELEALESPVEDAEEVPEEVDAEAIEEGEDEDVEGQSEDEKDGASERGEDRVVEEDAIEQPEDNKHTEEDDSRPEETDQGTSGAVEVEVTVKVGEAEEVVVEETVEELSEEVDAEVPTEESETVTEDPTEEPVTVPEDEEEEEDDE